MTAAPPDPSALDPLGGLGFVLDRVAHSLSRGFADALAPHGLTPMHLGVLSAVARYGPVNQSRLAGYLGVERQQMVNLINHLQERGLVERRDAPHDRRSWSIALTAAGAAARDRVADLGRRHTARTFDGLDTHEQERLTGLLLRLVPRGHFTELFRPP